MELSIIVKSSTGQFFTSKPLKTAITANRPKLKNCSTFFIAY